jgi:hypothetical protein
MASASGDEVELRYSCWNAKAQKQRRSATVWKFQMRPTPRATS